MSKPIFPALEKLKGANKPLYKAPSIEGRAASLLQSGMLKESVEPLSVPTTAGSPFTEIAFDHSKLTLGIAKGVNIAGFEIYLKRNGTTPNTRFTVIVGNKITSMIPGSRITGKFSDFSVIRENAITSDYPGTLDSSVIPANGQGQAVFVISTDSSYSYDEPDNPIDVLSRPFNLVGSFNKYDPTNWQYAPASGPASFVAWKGTNAHWFPVTSVNALLIRIFNNGNVSAYSVPVSLFYVPLDLQSINEADPVAFSGSLNLPDLAFTLNVPAAASPGIPSAAKTLDVSKLNGWVQLNFSGSLYMVQGIA